MVFTSINVVFFGIDISGGVNNALLSPGLFPGFSFSLPPTFRVFYYFNGVAGFRTDSFPLPSFFDNFYGLGGVIGSGAVSLPLSFGLLLVLGYLDRVF